MFYRSIFFALISFSLIQYGCINHSETESSHSEVKLEDAHNAQNAIDWPGTYFGVLPCASCPGINTTIELSEDGSYKKTIEYLSSNDTPVTTTGKFKWDNEGKIITIEENTYFVGENQLFALDANNQVIEGDLAEYYILTKEGN